MKKLIIVFNLLFVFGCVSNTVFETGYRSDGVLATSLDEGGYLTGSMTINKTQPNYAPFVLQSIYIRKAGTGETVVLSWSRTHDREFKTERGHGSTYSALLTPGIYEIYGVRFNYYSAFFEMSFKNDNEFLIPIEIKKGEVIYIGEFESNADWQHGKIGFSVPNDAFFKYQMNEERDIPSISTRIGVDPSIIQSIKLKIPDDAKLVFRD